MLNIKFSITPSKHTDLKIKVKIALFKLLRILNPQKYLITSSKYTLRVVKVQFGLTFSQKN
jgi:hypothetical protein